ncbi:hypothetical protein LINPERHAP2_LOCUS40192, partial [Linum perenne]
PYWVLNILDSGTSSVITLPIPFQSVCQDSDRSPFSTLVHHNPLDTREERQIQVCEVSITVRYPTRLWVTTVIATTSTTPTSHSSS